MGNKTIYSKVCKFRWFISLRVSRGGPLRFMKIPHIDFFLFLLNNKLVDFFQISSIKVNIC